MNAVPLAIPDGPRYASVSAPIRASLPAYSTAVAAVLSPASAEPVQAASNGYVPGGPIRLSPQPEAAPVAVRAAADPIRSPAREAALAQTLAAAEPIRLQPQETPDPASFAPAEPIRLSPQPDVDPASLAPAEPIRLRPQPVQVAAVEELPPPPIPVRTYYAPPAAPRQVYQAARLPEPPAPAPRPVQVAQTSRSPMVVPPEPPRQYAAIQAPFGPAPRPLGFSLISHANAEPIAPRRTGPLTTVAGNWAVQVGAFANEGLASAATQSARGQAREVLAYARTVVAGVRQPGGVLYRARLTGLSRDAAAQACERLQRSRTKCMVVSPDAQS